MTEASKGALSALVCLMTVSVIGFQPTVQGTLASAAIVLPFLVAVELVKGRRNG